MKAKYNPRAKRGPIPLEPSEKRNKVIVVHLNEAEVEYLDSQRQMLGMRRADYIRAAIAQNLPPYVPPANIYLWQDLGRQVASNLNQIAKWLNMGAAVDQPLGEYILEQLNELRHLLIQLRSELLTGVSRESENHQGQGV